MNNGGGSPYMQQDNEVLISSWSARGGGGGGGATGGGHGSSFQNSDNFFQPIRTLPAAILQFILCVSLIILVFVIPWKCDSRESTSPTSPNVEDEDEEKEHQLPCLVSNSTILIIIQAIFWALMLVIDSYILCQHHILMLSGYLEFDLKTRKINKVPYYVISIFNLTLLLVTTIFHEYCLGDDEPSGGGGGSASANGIGSAPTSLSPSTRSPDDVVVLSSNVKSCSSVFKLRQVTYVQLIIFFESVLLLPFISIYLVRVWRFNKLQQLPDAFQDDLLSSRNRLNSASSEVGYRSEERLDELLERQSEYIRHLQNHNTKLAKRILAITAAASTHQQQQGHQSLI